MTRLFNYYVPTGMLVLVALDAMIVFGAVLAGYTALPGSQTMLQAVTPAMTIAVLVCLVNGTLGLHRGRPDDLLVSILARAAIVFLVVLPLLHWTFFRNAEHGLYLQWLEATVLIALGGKLATLAFTRNFPWLFETRVMILGTGLDAAAVAEALGRSTIPGVTSVGFYSTESADRSNPHQVPANRILPSKSIGEITGKFRVNEIVVAMRERRGGALPMSELVDAKLSGVRITDMSSFFEHYASRVKLDLVRDSWFIYGPGFRQGLMRTVVKRAFDIVASLAILILAFPIMIVAALAVMLESDGPVFFKQERVGYKGRPFNILKFRSMRVDAEADGKARWAQKNDARVTRVGKFMRVTRIDELPQVFNVLLGSMSLVGPRPERPVFVDQLTAQVPYYQARHSVKPGVTGWAQIRHHYGASVEDAAGKLEYDLYYVKNHTLFFDLYILACSAQVVITGKGAR